MSGTVIDVSRANGSGACPAEVVAGVAALNGVQMFTPQKNFACGVDHFTLTVDFTDTDANQSSCMSTDTIMIPDLEEDGGSGTDSMAISCSDGTTCTETYDVTFTAQ